MRSEYLPFCRHALGEEEIAEVVDTLRSAWITTGPKTRRFEEEFATYLGAPGALALTPVPPQCTWRSPRPALGRATRW